MVLERHEFGTPRWAIPKSSGCEHCGSRIGPWQGWERVSDGGGTEIIRHTTPLYFDECTDGETRKALRRMGFCLVPMQAGRADTEWLKHAGRNGWTVITADERIMHVPEEKQAVIDHKVRCFILSPKPEGTWNTLRAFVAMWDKIRLETAFPGPAVWRVGVAGHADRWEQLVPSPPGYRAIDFSKTPAGHLLNLFADAVKQHDSGWFTADFVDALHDAIRVELESRMSRVAEEARTSTSQAGWERGFDVHPMLEPGETTTIDLEEPVDLGKKNVLLFTFESDEDGLRYQWIVPAHKFGGRRSADFDPSGSFVFKAASKGFHRSGFGLPLSVEGSQRPKSPIQERV